MSNNEKTAGNSMAIYTFSMNIRYVICSALVKNISIEKNMLLLPD